MTVDNHSHSSFAKSLQNSCWRHRVFCQRSKFFTISLYFFGYSFHRVQIQNIIECNFFFEKSFCRVQVDSNAFLHCSVINMDEETQVSSFIINMNPRYCDQPSDKDLWNYQVSWIRRRDWHIMSVGETVFTTDDRVQVEIIHKSCSAVLRLSRKLKSPQQPFGGKMNFAMCIFF